MTITTHATMGAVIGHVTGNPSLGFIFGFVSHFLIDMIPHGDSKMSDNYRVHKVKRKQAVAYVMCDALTALFFVLFLVNWKNLIDIQSVTIAVAGSVLPDFLVGLSEIWKNKYLDMFKKMHFFFHDYFIKKRGDVPLYYALLSQGVFIAFLTTRLG